MSIVKKTFWIILILLIIASILYLCYAIYLTAIINGVIQSALKDESYDNSLAYIISKEDYNIINPRQPELEEGIKVSTECSNTLPVVLPFITDVHYEYTYFVTDVNTGEVIYGSHNAGVVLKLDYHSFPARVVDADNLP